MRATSYVNVESLLRSPPLSGCVWCNDKAKGWLFLLQGFATRGTPIYKARKTVNDVLGEYSLVPPIARGVKEKGTGTGKVMRSTRSVDDKAALCSTYPIRRDRK